MIAFHYPPLIGSSGILRTQKFAQYLPALGWSPLVLTVGARAYPQSEPLHEDTSDVQVERAFALDTQRHLSIAGFYPRWLASPDRWISWWPFAVMKGRGLIARCKPDIIWSTFPVATAHLIAATLHRMSGIPWVADFRDPMVDTDPSTGIEYPTDAAVRKMNARVERLAIRHCSRAVFTTDGTVGIYAERYQDVATSRWVTIANGYDEDDFVRAEQLPDPPRLDKVVLVHSGIIYPDARDPRSFFAALGELRRDGIISPTSLRIVLRASSNEHYFQQHLVEHGIDDIVVLEPPLPHTQALAEMLHANGLIVIQATNCNSQIPAKAYECLRAGKPILALTDATGDTARLLRSHGAATIIPLDDKDSIVRGFVRFLDGIRAGTAPAANRDDVAMHSRQSRTRELARVLDAVVAERRSASVSQSVSTVR